MKKYISNYNSTMDSDWTAQWLSSIKDYSLSLLVIAENSKNSARAPPMTVSRDIIFSYTNSVKTFLPNFKIIYYFVFHNEQQ